MGVHSNGVAMIIRVALCLAAMFLPNAGWADIDCNLDCQYAKRKSTLKVGDLQSGFEPFKPITVPFSFSSVEFEATNYRGTKQKSIIYPKIESYFTVTEIPGSAKFRAFNVRNSLFKLANNPDFSGRYVLEGEYFVDIEESKELIVKESIQFVIDNDSLFPELDRAKIIVSGPFWKQEEFGSYPLGLFKTKSDDLLAGYTSFSARHVLCINKGSLDLFTVDQFQASETGSGPKLLAQQINLRVKKECDFAFQVGPSYFERAEDEEISVSAGVSGFSLKPAGRVLLLHVGGAADGVTRLFLLSSGTELGSFDAMTFLGGFVDALSDGAYTINWAVGLQDDIFASGPVFLSSEGSEAYNDVSVPTGALLVVE